MTGRPYRVFLSAASLDLKSFRRDAAETLNQHAARICKHGPLEVVSQEEFPPDYQTVWEILRQRILECDAVICLVGYAYGREPRNVPPGFRRRSYTQMEFDIARALGKPVFLFRADDPSALDRHEPEPEELRNLQEQYRDELRQLDQVRESFKTKEELLARLEKLDLPPPSPRKPVNLPYTSIGTLFKGRDAFLKALREKLGAAPGRAVGVVARQAIHGLGGVGKTRLAIEYAWQNQADYTALLFVIGRHPGQPAAHPGRVGRPDGARPEGGPGRQGGGGSVRRGGALAGVAPGLVLDPRQRGHRGGGPGGRGAAAAAAGVGHVVITSRLGEWSEEVEPLELDVLDVEPRGSSCWSGPRGGGCRWQLTTPTLGLGRGAGRPGAGAGAGRGLHQPRALLAGGVPGAVAEAGEEVLEWFDERQMKYPKSVAVTWETTWSQLSPASRGLLEILSWYAPDPIPQWVLTGEASRPIAVKALGTRTWTWRWRTSRSTRC